MLYTNQIHRKKKKYREVEREREETETGENKYSPVQPTHVNP